MRVRRIAVSCVFILCFISVSFLVYAANNAQPDPKGVVQSLVDLIQKNIVTDSKMKDDLKKDTALFQKHRKTNIKFHKTLERYVAYESLGSISMPQKYRNKYWVVKPKNKRKFLKLLQQLIEEIVYPKAADFFGKVTITFKKPVLLSKGKKADLSTIIHFKKKSGEVENIDFLFRLQRAGQSWKVYDIKLDDQLWTEMFRNQFNHIITTKSYDVLIEKMHQKLKNVQNGASL